MGPYYDRANLDRIEADIEHDRMIELIRLRQGSGRPRPMPVAATAIVVLLLFVPVLVLPML